MKNRAYSVFEVKSVDEERRVITGIATTPSTDRAGDIVEPKGAEFKLPLPLLWQHNHGEPVGNVTKATVTAKGIEVEVELPVISEAGKLKDLVDMAWQSVKAKLVRGFSIGFSPLEAEPIKGTYGLRFLKWSWIELSLVTVPANAEATIQTVKRLDTAQLAAIGNRAGGAVSLTKSPGVTGVRLTTVKNGAVKLTQGK